MDTCTTQDHEAIANAQSQATTARKKANDALLTSVSNQQGTLQTDADALTRMQHSASSATGQMQAIQSANQLASAQTNQLLQIRSLLIAQQNAFATSAQIEADRDAQRLAASNRALAGRNSKSSEKEW